MGAGACGNGALESAAGAAAGTGFSFSFFSAGKDWNGTPTELSALLGVDMKPNALTRRLNVNAGRLLNEYGIRYESSRNRNERTVKLAATERS